MKALISLLPLVFVAATSLAKTAPQTTDLAVQNTQAVLWMQNAGEYRALCYQAYNTAMMAFDLAKAKHQGKLAVMVDLDETMLDNSPYAAWQIQHHQPYETVSWNNWVNAVQTLRCLGRWLLLITLLSRVAPCFTCQTAPTEP
ncbi:MAG: hypothetical protein LRY40_03985 [Shewanella fodinae]|nr:hypothetical protein [Shewanella fodinae]